MTHVRDLWASKAVIKGATLLVSAALLVACGGADGGPADREGDPTDLPPDGTPGGGSGGLEAGSGGTSEGGSGGSGVGGSGVGGSGLAGSGAGGEGASIGVGGAGGSGAAGTIDPPVTSGCGAASLAAGDHAMTLEHGGQTREYDVHVPASYDPNRETPVVFYFHPLLMNKEYLKGAGGVTKSDQEGFIAVFAQGIESSWNAGACCGPANGAGSIGAVDDVGFVRAMVDDLKANACVDSKRVYATGFSNGGFLSNRLACEAADVFAAVAPVSAVNGVQADCTPSRPMPVFAINGTTDTLVPYQGGFFFPGITNGAFVSVADTFSGWAGRNGCAGAPIETYSNGSTTCQTFASCAGGVEVTQCTVDGGGHCWFGELFCALGTNSFDIIATDATWAFLQRFTLP